MKFMRWTGLPVVVFLFVFGSCVTDPNLAEVAETVDSDPDRSEAGSPPPTTETPEESRIRMAEFSAALEERLEAQRVARALEAQTAASTLSPTSRPVVTVRRTTPVQLAPSFFEEALLTDPRERPAFHRQWPEARIIGDDEALYNACLVVFARAVVHEANWIHRPCDGSPGPCDPTADHNHAEYDAPAMFQVFRYTRRDHETLLGSMRNHMNYATEEVPARRERSRWIVELDLEGNRPEHFPATDANGNPLDWERDYRPRWMEMLALSRQLFSGRGLRSLSRAPLVTWGGRCEDAHGACDDGNAVRRGLVPFEVGDSSNRFWCNPARGVCPTGVETIALPAVTPALEAPPPVVEATVEVPDGGSGPLAFAP